MPTPLEIAIEAIAESYYSMLVRLCECERLRREYARDLELASVADIVIKALAEERSVEAGPVKIEVRRRLLGKSVRILLWDNEVTPDELLTKVSQARSRAAWLQSDCSDQALLEPVYSSNDREAIEYAVGHLGELSKVCEGTVPRLDSVNLQDYVKQGILRGIEQFLKGR